LLWRRGGLCDLTGFSDIDFEPVASKLDLCRDGACAVAYALLLQDINPTVVCTSLLASHVSRVLPSHWCICSCHFRTNTVYYPCTFSYRLHCIAVRTCAWCRGTLHITCRRRELLATRTRSPSHRFTKENEQMMNDVLHAMFNPIPR
jgi:hypothetical protein